MRRAPAAAPDLPGLTFTRVLGSGGFSDVHLYEQHLPRRRVAVKVLLTDSLDGDVRADFVAEANVMAQLSAHPYIVTIHHADVAPDGRPYFVMEYCEGPSLAERYKRERFAVDDALRTGIRIAGAVATAHAAGILHRDIKPANVLTNGYGWPALTDFGISSALDDELPVHTTTSVPSSGDGTSGTRSAVGMSVPWSPPEMFEDVPRPDARSDVFSLAATVHTLLAGRTPFEIVGRPNGTLDLIGRIERGAITPIERDDVPASLIAVLARGMATRRSQRYRGAVEFARALQRVELELGYAPTPIDVPRAAGVVDERPGPGASPVTAGDEDDPTRARSVTPVIAQPLGDEDATRARAVTPVIAQPPAAVAPPAPASAIAPPPPAPAARPAEQDDATRVREVRSVAAQTRRYAAGARQADSDAVIDDGTVLRGATRAGTEAHDRTTDELPTRPAAAARRRAGVGAWIAAASVLVVGASIAAAVLLGEGLAPAGDDAAPGSSGSAVAGVAVPAPEVTAEVVDGDAVFTLANTDAVEGDRFRWAPADGSGAPAVLEPGVDRVVVASVVDGVTTCIDVQVQRGGRLSDPVRGCTP
ncbi:serine/threonine-protein kinase [Agromyces sp. SYSU T00194]|uniref:serine/threonine-protein kinase n=1 Tax=Agromyces chitinivorans TaxID=3158560 RepID=UPI00339588B8